MTRDEKLYLESVDLLLKLSKMIKDEHIEVKEMRLQRLERIAIIRVQPSSRKYRTMNKNYVLSRGK